MNISPKTVNRDTVWGAVPSGDWEETRPGTKNRQKLPILDLKILSLKHPDFCLLPLPP